MEPEIEIFVGEESPATLRTRANAIALAFVETSGGQSPPSLEEVLRSAHPLSKEDFVWPPGVRVVWPGMDSSRCAAAVNAVGAAELDRFLAGAGARGETALMIIEVGNPADRFPIYGGGGATHFPEHLKSLYGQSLPGGIHPHLLKGVADVEKDLAVRIRDHHSGSWCAVRIPASKSEKESSLGNFEPLLEDDVGTVLAGVWIPNDAKARCYLIPYGSDWNQIVDWLIKLGVPTLVPQAARRTRAIDATPNELLSPKEREARERLAQLDSEYETQRSTLKAEQAAATEEAHPVREALLFGRDDELKKGVARVLKACGFDVEDLDDSFGSGQSADLLVTLEGKHWLTEVRFASSPSERDIDDLHRHLRTWSGLGRSEILEGGVFIVNHHAQKPPLERPAAPYQRQAFVETLDVTIIGTSALFEWFRSEDCDSLQQAVTGPPRQHPRTAY